MSGFRVIAVCFSFALLCGVSPALAGGLQFDVTGVYALPTGDFDDGFAASDLFDNGFGVMGDLLFGLNDNLYVGGSLGLYRNDGGLDFDGPGDEGPLDPEDDDFSLTSVPIHGLVQFRTTGSAFGFYGEGGLGFTRHSIDFDTADLGISGSQTSFSVLLGGGIAYSVRENLALTSGLKYHQSFTGEGEVWFEDDNPKFLLWTFGIRVNR